MLRGERQRRRRSPRARWSRCGWSATTPRTTASVTGSWSARRWTIASRRSTASPGCSDRRPDRAPALLARGLLRSRPAALRPVEAMRRRAAEISERRAGPAAARSASRDEIAELGATLNEMLDRLEEALDRERRFVADASHELRTPLTILKAEIELALAEGRSAERDACRPAVGWRGDRPADSARRGPAGARPRRRGPIADGRRAGAGRRAGRSGWPRGSRPGTKRRARLRISVADELEVEAIRCDSSRRSRTWSTTRSATGPARSRSAPRSSDGFSELHVTDEGTGFPAELLARAFERFSRADAVRARGGAGLGLAIVDAIAKAHGGSVRRSQSRRGWRRRLDHDPQRAVLINL